MTGENNQKIHTPRPIGDDSPRPDATPKTPRPTEAKINQKNSEKIIQKTTENKEKSTEIQDSPEAENLIEIQGVEKLRTALEFQAHKRASKDAQVVSWAPGTPTSATFVE